MLEDLFLGAGVYIVGNYGSDPNLTAHAITAGLGTAIAASLGAASRIGRWLFGG